MNFVFQIGPMSMRDAAMRWGTRVGLEIIAAFCFYLAGVYDSSLWAFFSLALMIYIPCHAVFYMFVWRFIINRGDKRFFSLMGFGLTLFMYAVLLASVAYFIYFQFIDHGYLAQNFLSALSDPEARKALEQVMSVQQVEQMEAGMDSFMALTPIQVTVQLMMMNYMICLPVVFIGSVIISIMPEPRFIKNLHKEIERLKKKLDSTENENL